MLYFGSPVGKESKTHAKVHDREVHARCRRFNPASASSGFANLLCCARELGPQIQWLETFVTPNKVYCVFIAPNEEIIREHARLGGFAADSIAVITEIVDPSTAESCKAVMAVARA